MPACRNSSKTSSADAADSGAVTLIQRVGSAAKLNIHLHCLVLEGVYRRTDGEPVFVEAHAPTDEELRALLHKIITRLMSPLEFMQRLAALVPRPRLHLNRFHSVLAPHAKLRALEVPNGPEQATGKSELTATESGCTHSRPAHIRWAGLLKRVSRATWNTARTAVGSSRSSPPSWRHRGQARILRHLGLEARAPPRVPALGDLQQAA